MLLNKGWTILMPSVEMAIIPGYIGPLTQFKGKWAIKYIYISFRAYALNCQANHWLFHHQTLCEDKTVADTLQRHFNSSKDFRSLHMLLVRTELIPVTTTYLTMIELSFCM